MAKEKATPPLERYKLLRGKNVGRMTDENLIEWVAVLAHEGKENWGFLEDEILRRLREGRNER